MKAYVCDGCGKSSEERLFPMGWMRVHFWGRPDGEGHMSKLGAVDACSAICARTAVEESFPKS